MSEKEIIEGDTLIAEFMGKKVVGSTGEYIDIEFQDGRPLTAHYHTSWDWLIPVVHKCCADLREKGFDIRGSWNPTHGYVSEIYVMKLNNPIEKVWIEVVNYIKRFK